MSNLRLINETEIGTSVLSVSVTDVFSADFDIYKITLEGVTSTGASGLDLRFINASGSVISASNYDRAGLQMRSYGTFIEQRATNDTELQLYAYSLEGGGQTSVGYVFNPYSSSSYTFSLNQSAGFVDGNGVTPWKNIGVLKQTASMTGFQLFNSSVNFDNGVIRTYGLRVDS